MSGNAQKPLATRELPRRVALVANQDEILYRFRMPMVRALCERGIEVFAITPPGDYVRRIEENGARFIPWHVSRNGRNPITELVSIAKLTAILRRIKPGLVQSYHVKPNIYAPAAARLARVPVVVSSVTGLGYVFTRGDGIDRAILRRLMFVLYRVSSTLSSKVTFQNRDDIDVLRKGGGISGGKGLFIRGGSGVELDVFDPAAYPPPKSAAMRESLQIPLHANVVLFIGRLLLDKGVQDFAEAAKQVKAQQPETIFVLVGPRDTGNRRVISKEMLDGWIDDGRLLYLGQREDVPALMAMADIVALPSYYREGVPRVLLEAAAMGKAVIAADMPGMRDTVVDRENGILIPPQDVGALATAVLELVVDQDQRRRYGDALLELALAEFDHRKVVESYLELYRNLWARSS